MRIEGRDLIDLRQRHLHLGGERGKVRGGNVTIVILDQMKMLDQEIAPTGPVSEKRAHFHQCLRVDLTALWGSRRAATATPRINPTCLWPLSCDAHLKIFLAPTKTRLNRGMQALHSNRPIDVIY